MALYSSASGMQPTDVSYIRDQVTSCESGYLNTTGRQDALANLSRFATFVRPVGASQGGFVIQAAPSPNSEPTT